MPPSAIDPQTTCDHPPPKRRKTTSHEVSTISPHPLRIKPLGNAFAASPNLRDISTGNFALLPDELIIQLLGYLEAESLLALGSTSKGLYAFCRCEELWKDLFMKFVYSPLIFPYAHDITINPILHP